MVIPQSHTTMTVKSKICALMVDMGNPQESPVPGIGQAEWHDLQSYIEVMVWMEASMICKVDETDQMDKDSKS
jgi:hypothetical protein